jgi:hypothetical protein
MSAQHNVAAVARLFVATRAEEEAHQSGVAQNIQIRGDDERGPDRAATLNSKFFDNEKGRLGKEFFYFSAGYLPLLVVEDNNVVLRTTQSVEPGCPARCYNNWVVLQQIARIEIAIH